MRKNKLFIVVTVVTVCVLLAMGTFAWTNFNSSVINSWFGSGKGKLEPGGTLHNDYIEGEDFRDIYIENWGSEPLIVRISLAEYMEMGPNAGTKNDPEKNQATSVINGASIDDVSTWGLFPGNLEHIIIRNGVTNVAPISSPSVSPFSKYWKWTMGGQKYYYPAPEDKRNTLDANGVDFVSTTSPAFISGTALENAEQTLNADIIGINDWIHRGSHLGNYWVVDTDGFSYWAAPLDPGDATGLLLHKVELIDTPTTDYFYGIYVDGQMATIDDAPNNYEKFLLNATKNAGVLINKIAAIIRQEKDVMPDTFFKVETLMGRYDLDYSKFMTEMEPIIFQSINDAHAFYYAYIEVFSDETFNDKTLLDSRFDNEFFDERALLFVPFTTGFAGPNLEEYLSIANVSLVDGVLVVVINRHRAGLFIPDAHYFIINISKSLISEVIRVEFKTNS